MTAGPAAAGRGSANLEPDPQAAPDADPGTRRDDRAIQGAYHGGTDGVTDGETDPGLEAEESAAAGPDDLESGPDPLPRGWGSPRPTGGFGAWLRWGWRRLASMRTALVLLFLLALAAIPGSVFPQRGTDPGAVTAWIDDHPDIGPVLSALGLFDVFASAWFAAIYLLLLISLFGCVVPRTVEEVRSWRRPISPPPRTSRRYPTRTLLVAPAAEVPAAERERLVAGIAESLGRQRWVVREDPGARWVVAEKGRLGEVGNLLFHLSLVVLLLGVAVGSLLGWRGTVIVREGHGFANTPTAYDSLRLGRLASTALPPFSFQLDDFDVTFERTGSQRGAPRSFQAELSYRADPQAQAVRRSVSVNSPLSVDGAKVYLLGHGYAPHIKITDSTGRVVFDDTVVFLPRDGNFTSTGVVKAPDGQPPLALEGLFLPSAAVDPVRGPYSSFPAPDDPALFLSAWTGDLGLDSGTPQSVYSLDTSGLKQVGVDALRLGEVMELPGGAKVEFVGFDRWASFTVAHDPGKLLALLAAIATILAASLSLFLRRRRIWLVIHQAGGEVRFEAAGSQRRESSKLADEVALLTAAVTARVGAAAVVESGTGAGESAGAQRPSTTADRGVAAAGEAGWDGANNQLGD